MSMELRMHFCFHGMMLQGTDYLCYAEHERLENGLFWNKSKVSSQSHVIDEGIREIRQIRLTCFAIVSVLLRIAMRNKILRLVLAIW